MNEHQLRRFRPYLTALVFLAELGHLAWEHFSGGVVSHNILNRRDLPAISNWWGLVLLPLLTWFVIGRVKRRISLYPNARQRDVFFGFIGSLLLSVSLAISFATGYQDVSSYIFKGMLLLALLLPIYRAECLLGFVLGMTFTFGAVLPTAIGSIIAAISASIGSLVRWVIGVVIGWLRRTRSV